MKNVFSRLNLVLLVLFSFVLTGCAGQGAYEKGVDAQTTANTGYMKLQEEQLDTIKLCYMWSKDTTHCSVAYAGTTAVQILGGRPTPIRIAKSVGEITESVLSLGFDGAVKIYGLKAVSDVLRASVSEAGKVQIVKPEVVRPEIVSPEIIFAPQ